MNCPSVHFFFSACSDDDSVHAPCYPAGPTGTCPSNTTTAVCSCPTCTFGTAGPCHGPLGICSDYDISGPAGDGSAGAGRCPYGYFECGGGLPPKPADRACGRCSGGSVGPCQHPISKQCFALTPGTMWRTACSTRTEVLAGVKRAHERGRSHHAVVVLGHAGAVCPLGTAECTAFDAALPGPRNTTSCSVCNTLPARPCRRFLDGACMPVFPGTRQCPVGTAPCPGGSLDLAVSHRSSSGHFTASTHS